MELRILFAVSAFSRRARFHGPHRSLTLGGSKPRARHLKLLQLKRFQIWNRFWYLVDELVTDVMDVSRGRRGVTGETQFKWFKGHFGRLPYSRWFVESWNSRSDSVRRRMNNCWQINLPTPRDGSPNLIELMRSTETDSMSRQSCWRWRIVTFHVLARRLTTWRGMRNEGGFRK